MRQNFVILSALCLAPLSIFPQSYTNPTDTVEKGYVQWESNFGFSSSQGTRTNTLLPPLLRIGVSKKMELRLANGGFLHQRGGGSAADGLSDAAIGFQYRLTEEGKKMPALAIMPMITMPMGNQNFTTSTYDPGMSLLVSKDMPLGFLLGGSAILNELKDSDGRFQQNSFSLLVGRAVSKKLDVYSEMYSLNHANRLGDRITVLRAGVSLASSETSTIESAVGRRLTAQGPDWEFTVGWTARISLAPPQRWFK